MQTYTQPEHVPGLHNFGGDDLIRMIDADPSASPRELALANVWNDDYGRAERLEEQLTAANEELIEEQRLSQGIADDRDAFEEAADELRGMLRRARDRLQWYATEGDDDDAELVEEINATLAAFPSEAEKMAKARAEQEAQRVAIAAAEERAPGFAVLAGKAAKVEYMLPKGRKWHEAGRNWRLDLNALNACLRYVPERASQVRVVPF